MTDLVVFEGIDNSGKTTLSKEVYRRVANDYLHVSDLLGQTYGADPDLTDMVWTWAKEPVFSTEQADKLNDPSNNMDYCDREILFLESRLSQQDTYHSYNTFLDRYVWTGMAYAKMFSNPLYDFCKKLYSNENIFKTPSLTIFVDTPVEICHEREPEVSIERLSGIRDAFLDSMGCVKGPVEIMDNNVSLEEAVGKVFALLRKYIFTADHPRIKFSNEFPLGNL